MSDVYLITDVEKTPVIKSKQHVNEPETFEDDFSSRLQSLLAMDSDPSSKHLNTE